jgi:hypothetical protein
VVVGLDLDRAVAAGGLYELADRPAGDVLDPPADRERGEHDRQMCFDRVACPVVDGPTCRSLLAIPEALFDLEELVVGADHELRGHWRAVRAGGQVRDVALQHSKGAGLGLKVPVDGPGAAGQPDEPVPLHRSVPGHGLLGLADLLVDAAQRPAGPVSLVLVVDDLVAAAAVRAGRHPDGTRAVSRHRHLGLARRHHYREDHKFKARDATSRV